MISEWKTKKLSDIAEINPRESIKKGTLAKKISMDKLQPFCRDIPSYELEKFNGGTKFKNGDTIMARITPCLENGKIAKVSILTDGEVGFGSTEYIVFRAMKNMDEDFLYYLISSPIVREPAIKSMVGSSGRQRVQTDVLANLEIKLPTYEIQRRIGSILRDYDDKIAMNNAINRNLSEQAKFLFKEKFLDVGCMLLGWKEMTLDDVAVLSAGGDKPEVVSEIRSEECNVPIYSNGISNEGIYGFTTDAKIINESVTVSARGTIGFVCLRQEPYVPIVRLISVVPKENIITAKFLYLWLESLHIMGTGTTQQQLTVPDFKKTRIIVPSIQEIRKFTDLVNPSYDNILRNKKENEKLSELRDNLLPKLMSGELDVSDLDI